LWQAEQLYIAAGDVQMQRMNFSNIRRIGRDEQVLHFSNFLQHGGFQQLQKRPAAI